MTFTVATTVAKAMESYVMRSSVMKRQYEFMCHSVESGNFSAYAKQLTLEAIERALYGTYTLNEFMGNHYVGYDPDSFNTEEMYKLRLQFWFFFIFDHARKGL